jgi:hypothetical protein
MIHEYSLPELFTAIESLHVFSEEHRLYLLRVTIEKIIEERNAYIEWVMQRYNFKIG